MRTVINVVAIVFAVLCLVGAIILAVEENALYILVGVAGVFLSWLMWIVSYLCLTFLCDVKLIRNKLYGEDNSALAKFIEDAPLKPSYGVPDYGSVPQQPPVNQPTEQAQGGLDAKKIEALKELKKLYDSGAIDEEQYNIEKNKILNS